MWLTVQTANELPVRKAKELNLSLTLPKQYSTHIGKTYLILRWLRLVCLYLLDNKNKTVSLMCKT
jgi:hypothetical protein